MNISLTEELDLFVREQMATGMYKSASEVVRDGLRLLARRKAQVSFFETILDQRLMDPEQEPLDKAFWKTMREKARAIQDSAS